MRAALDLRPEEPGRGLPTAKSSSDELRDRFAPLDDGDAPTSSSPSLTTGFRTLLPEEDEEDVDASDDDRERPVTLPLCMSLKSSASSFVVSW